MISRKMIDGGRSGSSIREIAAFGAARAEVVGAENVFDFTIGSPSVPPPAAATEGMIRLLREMEPSQLHGYAPAAGIPAVREALARDLNGRFGGHYRADDLYLTCGASSALAILAKALLSPGDEVVVLAPYFMDYRVYAEDQGARLIEVPCLTDSFQPDLTALAAALTERTALVIVNSPNNPSGAVLGAESLRAIAALLEARRRESGHAIYLIADEPYRELVYGDAAAPFTPLFYDDTIYCYSFSKSLSLAGERIGFLALSPELTDYDDARAAIFGAARALGYICVPPLFQYLAAACVGQTADLSVYQSNRALLTAALGEMGFSFAAPQGAFYLFLRSPEADDRAFCRRAMAHDVLLVPGSDFGCAGYARLAYCVPPERIRRSLPLFRRLAAEYGLTDNAN